MCRVPSSVNGQNLVHSLQNGYTALHIAAKKDEIEVATVLLEAGAKANAESKVCVYYYCKHITLT